MGSLNPPLNPLLLAIASNCSFVARGFSGNTEHLAQLIRQGISHKGFAYIDILQPCVSFNRVNTFKWYKSRVYDLNEDPKYDPYDRALAFLKAQEWGEKIPLGIIYKADRPTLDAQESAIKDMSLVKQSIDQKFFESFLEIFK
jgi:2-oxoglutarate ferredoxin oxidoreductase subunit beta